MPRALNGLPSVLNSVARVFDPCDAIEHVSRIDTTFLDQTRSNPTPFVYYSHIVTNGSDKAGDDTDGLHNVAKGCELPARALYCGGPL